LTARTLKEYVELLFSPLIITFDSVSAYPFVEITVSAGFVLFVVTTYQKMVASGRAGGGVQVTTADPGVSKANEDTVAGA
jgi:hypothetical protein